MPAALSSALTSTEVAELRAAFPFFAEPPLLDGRPVAYLDAAATAQRPKRVLDAERAFLEHDYAAVHRGTSQAVGTATMRFESARAAVAEFVGARTPEQIVWAAGATDALNTVALGIGEANAGLGIPGSERYALGAGDEILVTEAEHHANLIPWQRLAVKTGAKLRYIPVDEYGLWSLDAARAAINARTRIFAFGYVSNVTGLLAPVAELAELARAVGALTVLDACQSVPHLPVDVTDLGVDLLAFSGHKM
ncbi:MAG: aminotransferase class V-fold PLP-dependent enzyme, partial [Leucobacter sp.]|nr:aminotransferase class V-fold PLP-dependent enzyme [Leucobacter sp.]